MKFSVQVDGVDSSFLDRLVAAANAKLDPKLRRLAARAARRVQTVSKTHKSAIVHPHAHVAKYSASAKRLSKRTASHQAIGTELALDALALAGAQLSRTPQTPGGLPTADFASAPEQTELPVDNPADTVAPAGIADTAGSSVFDVTLDQDAE